FVVAGLVVADLVVGATMRRRPGSVTVDGGRHERTDRTMTTVLNTPRHTGPYSLGTTEAEYQRLRAQAQVWEQATERVIDRFDLRPGSQCLDAGCGPGVTMRQLARRVGPRGRVVGIDIDYDLGLRSVAELRADGHLGCEFQTHDLTSDAPIPGGPYDVV